MASKTTVEFTDDTDGKPAAETLRFGVDGTEYEIDLSERNAAKLRKALEPWVSVGRRTGGRKLRSVPKPAAEVDTRAVRAWAAESGLELSARGRIPAHVLEKYHAAGN